MNKSVKQTSVQCFPKKLHGELEPFTKSELVKISQSDSVMGNLYRKSIIIERKAHKHATTKK